MKYDQPDIKFKNTLVIRLWIFCIYFFLGGSHFLHSQIVPGAANFNAYVPLLNKKRVGVVSNHTSTINGTHLVDTLIKQSVQIVKIFAPEHGFRGNAANGEHVQNQIDSLTQIPIISLYGSHKKPQKADVENVDVMLFDMQDVGVRYFTYLSTMHYMMEACAEYQIPVFILDRANPNGHVVDGPVLDTQNFKSMVGLHPIPLLHGMTLGELAMMIKGEQWIAHSEHLNLHVFPVENYNHQKYFSLKISPSPNLSSEAAILLYPSLGLFEGTIMSMGRGTDWPFEILGAPWLKSGDVEFTPKNISGKAVNPPYLNQKCKGKRLSVYAVKHLKEHQHIHIEWLIESYKAYGSKADFFSSKDFFDKLAGNSQLRLDIMAQKSAKEIRKSWKKDLENFKRLRRKYLIYTE